MTDKRIIEEMAKMDGWDVDPQEAHEWGSRGQWACKADRKLVSKHSIPKYLTSHDAVQNVIDGLTRAELIDYETELYLAIEDGDAIFIHKATPRQKCEAILKAKGLWEDDQ